jgi:pimeloyl-ACP methyl ester carboxylesterase
MLKVRTYLATWITVFVIFSSFEVSVAHATVLLTRRLLTGQSYTDGTLADIGLDWQDLNGGLSDFVSEASFDDNDQFYSENSFYKTNPGCAKPGECLTSLQKIAQNGNSTDIWQSTSATVVFGWAVSRNGKYFFYGSFTNSGLTANDSQILENDGTGTRSIFDFANAGLLYANLKASNNGTVLAQEWVCVPYANPCIGGAKPIDFALITPTGNRTVVPVSYVESKTSALNPSAINDFGTASVIVSNPDGTENVYSYNPNPQFNIDPTNIVARVVAVRPQIGNSIDDFVFISNKTDANHPEGIVFYASNSSAIAGSDGSILVDYSCQGATLARFEMNDNLEFLATIGNDSSPTAVYDGPNLSTDKVIGPGDTLDGKTVHSALGLSINDNGDIVVAVEFSDSTIGIYTSTLDTLGLELVDPVPDLMNGLSITQIPDSLAVGGEPVGGIAADGVAEVLMRISSPVASDQFQVSVEAPCGATYSANDYGALSSVDDQVNWSSTVNVTSVTTNSGEMAFLLYRAPADFPREGGIDDAASKRWLTIQISEKGKTITKAIPITIVRPPVVLVHGLWGSSKDWNNFLPFINDPEGRFSVLTADYSDKIGSLITGFTPIGANPVPALLFAKLFARSNSLGFAYNAPKVLSQIGQAIDNFKNGGNPSKLQVAAVQADIVAHSMGGDISRYLPLLGNFYAVTNFSRGPVHKVITIDTPHLGSPLAFDLLPTKGQDVNACVRNIFMLVGNMAFTSVSLGSSSVASGAINDLSEDPSDGTLSLALQTLHESSTPRLPTALIGSAMSQAQLDTIDTPPKATAILILICGSQQDDTLAINLNSLLWPTVFGGLNSDAIVSLPSQLDGLSGTFFTATAVHSQGAEDLGFATPGGPNVLDQNSGVPQQVIDMLNIPVTDNSTYNTALP